MVGVARFSGDGDLVDEREGVSIISSPLGAAYSHRRPLVEQTRQCGKDSSHCGRRRISAARINPPKHLEEEEGGSLTYLNPSQLASNTPLLRLRMSSFLPQSLRRRTIVPYSTHIHIPVSSSSILVLTFSDRFVLVLVSQKRSDNRIVFQWKHKSPYIYAMHASMSNQ